MRGGPLSPDDQIAVAREWGEPPTILHRVGVRVESIRVRFSPSMPAELCGIPALECVERVAVLSDGSVR